MILEPSASLWVPAVLSAVTVYESVPVIFSWSENLIYISSWVDVSPIVVSVPKNIKCLSGVETNICLEAVGASASRVALVLVAPATEESHSKHFPL